MEVDASTTGVGAVLSQQQGTPANLQPCAFFSRKLSPAEKNYDIGNRELLAIKLALEEWRHWLEEAQYPFTILTDHKNLQYLWEAKRLNPRQARWALFFTRFNFTISYRPGPRNVKADALSRLHAPEEIHEEPEPIISEDRSMFRSMLITVCSQSTTHSLDSFHSHFSGHWPPRGQQHPLAAVGSLLVAQYGQGCEKVRPGCSDCAISRALATYHLASSFCCPFPTALGHT